VDSSHQGAELVSHARAVRLRHVRTAFQGRPIRRFCVAHRHPGAVKPLVDTTTTAQVSLPVGELGVAETSFTYEQALAWLSSHPATEPHFMRFQNQASELGDGVMPGMIEVLERGPINLHRAAAFVLSYHDIQVKTYGSTVEDFEYRLSRPGRFSRPSRRERVVRPQHLKPEDITEDAFITKNPTLTDANVRRFFFQYLVMFAVAVGLAVAGAKTGGVAGTVLWIVAGLLFALTLWSVLFMTVMTRLFHMINRRNAGS
jgi:hypothetical protein